MSAGRNLHKSHWSPFHTYMKSSSVARHDLCKPHCFCTDKSSLLVGLQASLSLVRALAAVWAVSEEQVQHHICLTKPALQTSHSDVTIGRAVLPLAAQSTNGGMLSPANANKVRVCLYLVRVCVTTSCSTAALLCQLYMPNADARDGIGSVSC